MAFNPGSTKRQKEASRREHQQKKNERKEQRKRDKDTREPGAPTGGVDPDIAGIVPGPQPLPDDFKR
jgi:hypothetical protein